MKKFLFAVMVFLLMILAACSSTDAKIDRFEKLINEYVELQGDIVSGDDAAAEKALKLESEIEAVTDELDRVELSDEQVRRLQEIIVKAHGKAVGLGINPFE